MQHAFKADTVSRFDAIRCATVALRGCGNLCFQSSAATGVLFFIAVFVNSRIQFVSMLIGAILGPTVGHLLREDQKILDAGRYGFSPCLVALALATYLTPSTGMFVMIVIGCLVSAVLTRIALHLATFHIFASPYVLTVWIALPLAEYLGLPFAHHANPDVNQFHLGRAIIEGLGSALFSPCVLSGLLYVVAVAVSNPRHALVAVIGSIVGTSVACFHHDNLAVIQTGYYSFNGVLCSVATYVYCGPSLRLPILGAILATMLIDCFSPLGLQPLGAPFVLTTWVLIALDRLEKALGMESPVRP